MTLCQLQVWDVDYVCRIENELVRAVWRYYEGVSKSFRTDRLERELQMVQLSATRCSYTAISRVSLVSFTTISICVASQGVFAVVVVVYFVIDSVRKLLDTPSYTTILLKWLEETTKDLRIADTTSEIWTLYSNCLAKKHWDERHGLDTPAV
jgi:hypothetical protein